jgi:hypothetical protein
LKTACGDTAVTCGGKVLRIYEQMTEGSKFSAQKNALPDLRVEIARCERKGKTHDACGVHYLGLI